MKSSDYRVLVTGAGGLLGKYLVKVLEELGIMFFGFDRSALDITDLESLQSIITPLKLTHIINCAAYTNVVKAEVDRDLCYKVNVMGVQNLVKVSNQMNIELIQISTDYVFDGMSEDGVYYPNSKKNPINYYGLSKSLGEDYIVNNSYLWKIVRTSWLFGDSKNNFLMKILKKSKNNEVIRINDVEIGTPTYAYDLARTIILNLNMVKGVYHITNSGIASRFHYAENILCLTTNGKILVNNDLNDDVKRPRKSILNSDIQFGLRHWTEALHEYLMNWKE